MDEIMEGEATPAQIAAFLVALRMKGETAEEIAGFVEAMRARVTPVRSSRENLVDTCGTGGDSFKTFNISTAAAFVAAATGITVAKHGNRAVSSACGSADVLEALGVRINLSPERMGEALDEVGLAFLFAPTLHPAMKHAGPVRKELKLRTVFNVLGPLTNPAGARHQVVGVYSRELVPLIGEALAQLGSERAVVVHGEPGTDEVSPIGVTHFCVVESGKARLGEWTPAELGLGSVSQEDMVCRNGHAEVLRSSISDLGSRSEAVIGTAGVAIWCVEGGSVIDCVSVARSAIESGAAADKLEQYRRFTNDNP